MMLRLQRFKLNIVYKRGSEMHVSDHLSRSPIEKNKSSNTDWELFTLRAEALMTELKTTPEISTTTTADDTAETQQHNSMLVPIRCTATRA